MSQLFKYLLSYSLCFLAVMESFLLLTVGGTNPFIPFHARFHVILHSPFILLVSNLPPRVLWLIVFIWSIGSQSREGRPIKGSMKLLWGLSRKKVAKLKAVNVQN